MFQAKIFLFLIFLHLPKVFSLYLGNPAAASFPDRGMFIATNYALGISVAYAKDHVFKKKFHANPSLELVRNANHAVALFNWNQRIEFYGAVGEESIGFKNQTAQTLKEKAIDWSIGGSAVLMEWGKICVCAAGAYLQTYPPAGSHSNLYQEWEIGLSLCKRIDYFSFYALGGFSKAYYRYRNDEFLKSAHPFLLSLGASFFTKKAFSMNGELRFFGETALGFDFAFKF